MTDPLLDALMTQILAKMSVISEQAARSYEGVSVHGGEKNTEPHLNERPMAHEYQERYAGAKSLRAKREVVREALEALKIARRMTVPAGQPPTPDSPMWKSWIAADPRSSRELGRLFNVNHAYILQIRENYKK